MLLRPWNITGQDPDWIAEQQAELDELNKNPELEEKLTLELLPEQVIQSELDIYFEKQLNYTVSANIDDHEYNLVGTDFDNDQKRAAYFYTIHPPDGYYVDFPNPRYIKLNMFVDPCRLRGTTDLCCDGANELVCEDNVVIQSGTDIGIAWFTNGFVLRCAQSYQEVALCGTFIEIHKPNHSHVEEALEISKTFSSGYSTEFISTKNLCAGRYEFWWVVRSANGSTLQYVKPFYSVYPSCEPPAEGDKVKYQSATGTFINYEPESDNEWKGRKSLATIKAEMDEKEVEKPEERKVIDGDLADEDDKPVYFGKDKQDEESKEGAKSKGNY